ncbi:GntR family transcriptional regulator [Achromobacter sp. GG226]|uniref:GntR family transcriptional regulator n=1 Tax=Verticiella alkaliphila TaxID=2779529 RepID=UPI001C0AAAB2|nr:GntR family transcriptional regulator [Verticiella sp. GG226]MBU4609647.1 GntR family transcriptional regulator [Verticiella sp. GG226]
MTTRRATPLAGQPARKSARRNSPAASGPLGEDRSPIPLYHRLYVILRERIVNGTYRVGETLPTEAELTETYGVSRITAKRALDELAGEGLAVRVRGRGTTVTRSGALRSGGGPIAAGIDGLLANLSLIGHGTSVEMQSFDYVTPPPDVIDALDLPAGALVQCAVRVRHLDGSPFSRSTSYVVESIGRTFTEEELTEQPLIELLARAGVELARVQQTITATVADHESSRHLDVSVGSPLLKLLRVFYDADDRAVDYVEMLYRPDRFEYRMTLSRGANNRFHMDPVEAGKA